MDAIWKSTTGGSDSSTTSLSQSAQSLLNDKLVEKIIYMALPASNGVDTDIIENRVQAGAGRPGLSVPIMSRNFMQLNSRLGPPFMVIDEIIRVFNWTNPAYTLCIMSFYSFLILKPLPMLVAGPFAYILFGVMCPTYMDIHKPDPHMNLDHNPIPARGPPLKSPLLPGPVSEFSKEFVLNLTDLQNHMTLYVMAYDFVTGVLSKFAYFKNEDVSAAVYLSLFIFSCAWAMVIDSVSQLIPWKLILLSVGWLLAIVLHPKIRDAVFQMMYSEETRLRILTQMNQLERAIKEKFEATEPRERREASIFELQRFNEDSKSWELIGYSSEDYTPYSEVRLNGTPISQISTVPTLADVKPPVEWEWLPNFDWTLDLHPTEWVSASFLRHVDIDNETKWVYDINDEEEVEVVEEEEAHRGQYRRRRWIKLCSRQKHRPPTEKNKKGSSKTENEADYTDIEDDNEDTNTYNGYAAITQTSFSGFDKTHHATGSLTTDNGSSDAPSFGLTNSTSNASIPSLISEESRTSDSKEKSKAIKSLSDLLSITSTT